MSGECDECGEHCTDCLCYVSPKSKKRHTITLTNCSYTIEDALRKLLEMPGVKRLMRELANE